MYMICHKMYTATCVFANAIVLFHMVTMAR